MYIDVVPFSCCVPLKYVSRYMCSYVSTGCRHCPHCVDAWHICEIDAIVLVLCVEILKRGCSQASSRKAGWLEQLAQEWHRHYRVIACDASAVCAAQRVCVSGGGRRESHPPHTRVYQDTTIDTNRQHTAFGLQVFWKELCDVVQSVVFIFFHIVLALPPGGWRDEPSGGLPHAVCKLYTAPYTSGGWPRSWFFWSHTGADLLGENHPGN